MQFLDSSSTNISFKQPVAPPTAYVHNLSFYTEPPSHDISLEQFEKLALDRLAGAPGCSNVTIFNPALL